MLLPLSEIDKCFEKILKKSSTDNDGVSLVIIVGPDVDSICATLIIMVFENF